jgi:hypothetical protein
MFKIPLRTGRLPDTYILPYGRSTKKDIVESFFTESVVELPTSYQLTYTKFSRQFKSCLPFVATITIDCDVKISISSIEDDMSFPAFVVDYLKHDYSSFGILLIIKGSVEDYTNIIWFDPRDRTIVRYDPSCRNDDDKIVEDDVMNILFTSLFEDWTYTSSILPANKCLSKTKLYLNCNDYSMLYALRRMNGQTHIEAAIDINKAGEKVRSEIAKLLDYLGSSK